MEIKGFVIKGLPEMNTLGKPLVLQRVKKILDELPSREALTTPELAKKARVSISWLKVTGAHEGLKKYRLKLRKNNTLVWGAPAALVYLKKVLKEEGVGFYED